MMCTMMCCLARVSLSIAKTLSLVLYRKFFETFTGDGCSSA